MNRAKQILAGLVLIVLGILSMTIENDATAAVFIIPLGIYAIFTKENVFEVHTHGGRKDI